MRRVVCGPRLVLSSRPLVWLRLVAGSVLCAGFLLWVAVPSGSAALSVKAFVGGSLSLDASPQHALFSVRRMAPGDEAEGSIVITNNGTLAGRLTFESRARGGLVPALRLTVYRDRNEIVNKRIYSGPVETLRPIALGYLLPGRSTRLFLHVVLSKRAGNVFEGARANVDFRWTARAA